MQNGRLTKSAVLEAFIRLGIFYNVCGSGSGQCGQWQWSVCPVASGDGIDRHYRIVSSVAGVTAFARDATTNGPNGNRERSAGRVAYVRACSGGRGAVTRRVEQRR